MESQSVSVYDNGLWQTHQSALSLRHKYLLTQMQDIHPSTSNKFMQKNKSLFTRHFPQQLLPSFYRLSSAQSYYYSHATPYFTTQNVYLQQCAMSQAAKESVIY